jgi:hypothetical protein
MAKVKVKVYRTKIPLPIYGYAVHLIYTDNLEEAFKQEMVNDKLNITWLPGEGSEGFHVHPKDRNFSYIFLKMGASLDEIVHEAYHGVCGLMKWIGAEYEEEICAYTIGYLVSLMESDYRDAKKKYEKTKKVLDKTEKV